ncbi:acyltransferase family protein [Litorilituus lipolyticus]|uniref:Acyltransferase n=1 Tax=Litorilituus lipolyticus TaxID=2491017 RepID=A0A502L9Z0_9GAMM|nr:acyltransferase [Litorilituus lipolyticus]TPH17067.1 acyltransferase [Litorilituus lipolyticus]
MKVNRFDSLDALRGLAALLVVWQHSSESFNNLAGSGFYLADIAWQIDFGRIGVVCFFLISGFVIPTSFYSTNTVTVWTFALRRFFRLYPIYWSSILLAVALGTLANNSYSHFTILANSTMLQSFFRESHILGLYWTLQIELIFYCFAALLFKFSLLKNIKVLTALVLTGTIIFMFLQLATTVLHEEISVSKEFQLIPYMLSIMFLGAIYRAFYDHKLQKIQCNRYTVLATLVCFSLPALILVLEVIGLSVNDRSIQFGLSHLLALTIFLLGLSVIDKVPSIIVYLGAISYSLYLFHPIIIKGVTITINSSFGGVLKGEHLGGYMIGVLLGTILLSVITYHGIEKPSNKLGYKITSSKVK